MCTAISIRGEGEDAWVLNIDRLDVAYLMYIVSLNIVLAVNEWPDAWAAAMCTVGFILANVVVQGLLLHSINSNKSVCACFEPKIIALASGHVWLSMLVLLFMWIFIVLCVGVGQLFSFWYWDGCKVAIRELVTTVFGCDSFFIRLTEIMLAGYAGSNWYTFALLHTPVFATVLKATVVMMARQRCCCVSGGAAASHRSDMYSSSL